MPGATSQTVYKGMGKPLDGMVRNDERREPGMGLAAQGRNTETIGAASKADDEAQRALNKDAPRGRGNKGERTAGDMPSTIVGEEAGGAPKV